MEAASGGTVEGNVEVPRGFTRKMRGNCLSSCLELHLCRPLHHMPGVASSAQPFLVLKKDHGLVG